MTLVPVPANSAETNRRSLMVDTKRAFVLDAARAVFEEAGLEGASVREIAKRAGYTPGAIYSYFPSKEAIYAALVAEALDRLKFAVLGAKQAPAVLNGITLTAQARLMVGKAQAWFKFYSVNPKDLDLGFYLFHGMRPRGLTGNLNTQLNAQLISALEPVKLALVNMGLGEEQARLENTGIFAHGVGLLLLQHTGRIRLFNQTSDSVFSTYLLQACHRISGELPSSAASISGSPTSVDDDFLSRQHGLF
jgi:AcrR family transcriptional regulator